MQKFSRWLESRESNDFYSDKARAKRKEIDDAEARRVDDRATDSKLFAKSFDDPKDNQNSLIPHQDAEAKRIAHMHSNRAEALKKDAEALRLRANKWLDKEE